MAEAARSGVSEGVAAILGKAPAKRTLVRTRLNALDVEPCERKTLFMKIHFIKC